METVLLFNFIIFLFQIKQNFTFTPGLLGGGRYDFPNSDSYHEKFLIKKRGWDPRFVHYETQMQKCIDTLSIGRGIRTEYYFKKEEGNFFDYQYRMLTHRVRGIRTSLTELGKYYNIDHDYSTLHDAISDLKLNLKIWRKLRRVLRSE